MILHALCLLKQNFSYHHSKFMFYLSWNNYRAVSNSHSQHVPTACADSSQSALSSLISLDPVITWLLSSDCHISNWMSKCGLFYYRWWVDQYVLVSDTICVPQHLKQKIYIYIYSDICRLLLVVCPLWRGYVSVIYQYNFYCDLPALPRLGPSTAGLVTIFYCLIWDYVLSSLPLSFSGLQLWYSIRHLHVKIIDISKIILVKTHFHRLFLN
jgi:hypothetical protein